jgi:ATP-binding cassette subfamily B protein
MNSKKPLVMKAMQEGLGGIRDILIDGTQEIYSKIFYRNESEMRRSAAKVALITSTPNIAIQTIGIAIIAIFACTISINNSIANDNFSSGLPFLGALAFAYLRISPAIQQIYSTWANIKNGEPALNYVVNFLQKPLPSYAGKPLPQRIKFNENIEIKNLSFRYNNESNLVLNNINLKILKGSKVGFIGKTGSGKSTLLDIIMALIEPTSGSFEVDGVKINNNNFRSWQVRIAHVPQAIYLSDATILENIAFGVPINEIDLKRAMDAAEKAQISQTIENLVLKYNTKIGERGVRLSGGQRQRLGIARALYKKADVIIFDEATSALDNNTEIEVMKAIDELSDDLTIIIVAHRTSTLKSCSQVFEIIDEKIYEKNLKDFKLEN